MRSVLAYRGLSMAGRVLMSSVIFIFSYDCYLECEDRRQLWPKDLGGVTGMRTILDSNPFSQAGLLHTQYEISNSIYISLKKVMKKDDEENFVKDK